jgi:hypothetical protein
MPRTVENEAELPVKKVEHQALGSTLSLLSPARRSIDNDS